MYDLFIIFLKTIANGYNIMSFSLFLFHATYNKQPMAKQNSYGLQFILQIHKKYKYIN